MGILTLLRNAFSGRSRKGAATEAEGAETTPSQEAAPKLPSPAPEPTPAPPAATVPEPTPAPPVATVPEPRTATLSTESEHELVAAAFDKVTVPQQTSPEGAPEPIEKASGVTAASEEPASETEVPVTGDAVAEETGTEEKVAEEPVAEVASEEPVTEGAVAEKPVSEEAVAEEPVTEEAVSEEPVAKEPVAKEPVAEEPVADKAVTQEIASEEPVAEAEPAAEAEATAQKPVAAEDAVTEEPAADEAVAQDTAVEEPTAAPEAPAEEPVAEAPAPAAAEEEKPQATEPAPEPKATVEPEPAPEPVAEVTPEPEPAHDAPVPAPAAAVDESDPAEGRSVTVPATLRTAYDAAATTLTAHHLTGTTAKTYLVLDRSASMRPYYKDGSAQALGEQTLALAAHLDPESTVHVVFFSTELDGTGELTLTEHENKIDDLHAGLGRMGRTSYHVAVEEVLAHHTKESPDTPALVVFQTDGAPDAKTPATQALTEAAKTHPAVFFSFVAFGDPENKAFDYLRKLKLPNTSHFLAGQTPKELTDAEIYEGILANWRP
jgi:hypothetical protein